MPVAGSKWTPEHRANYDASVLRKRAERDVQTQVVVDGAKPKPKSKVKHSTKKEECPVCHNSFSVYGIGKHIIKCQKIHGKQKPQSVVTSSSIEWWVVDAAIKSLQEVGVDPAVVLSALSTIRRIHTEHDNG